MIWKKLHLNQTHLEKTQKVISKYICGSDDMPATTEETKVAIIGGGPKGFYALERLVAYLQNSPQTVTVDWFNETPHFASGNNYRIDQPEYLLINYNIGNINLWIDEQDQIPCQQSSLVQWIEDNKTSEEQVSFSDYASRSLVGAYLQDGLGKVLNNLPEGLNVNFIPESIQNFNKEEGHYKLITSSGTNLGPYKKLLIASGHSQKFDSATESKLKAFAEINPTFNFIPQVYPVEPQLTREQLGDIIAIKGVGLTFIDAALALTEGRGGSFISKEGRLIYQASGKEPGKIYGFSRSSLPMLPRGPIPQGEKHTLKYLTKEFFDDLIKKPEKGKIDFEKAIFPLLKKEIEDALSKESTKPSIESYLEPFKKRQIESAGHFHKEIQNYITHSLQEAKKGELASPLMAAVAVWREVTTHLGPIYNFGGFTPSSHEKLDKLSGNLCRVTYGPPIENMEKMLALIEHGILSFELGPSPEIILDQNVHQIILSASKYDFKIKVDTLIDARMARPNFRRGLNPLMAKLYQDGLIRPFFNGDYAPGCFDITENGEVIDSTGEPNPDIHFTGTPTEGITYDNDTLSRYRNNLSSPWAKGVISLLKKQNLKPVGKLN